MIAQSYTALWLGSTAAGLFSALWLTTAAAQTADEAQETGEALAYEFCLSEAEDDPAAAFDRAIAWADAGGGPPAVHCAAVALIGLGQFGEAAVRLDNLAQATNNGLNAELRAELLQQAGNAWMMEGFPEQAVESFNAALALDPERSGVATSITFDKARAFVQAGEWDQAVDNLILVLADQPHAQDALTLRATGYRTLGDIGQAQEDLNRVFEDNPDYAPALIEQGVIHRLLGDDDAARASWVRVLQVEEDPDLLASARNYLHDLDFPEGMAD